MPENPRSTASIAGQPLRPLLASFPTVCFTGALVNDIVYANTAAMQWANFSTWLLTAGLVIGGLAIVAELVDFFGDARVRHIPAATLHGIGAVAVMVVALVSYTTPWGTIAAFRITIHRLRLRFSANWHG